MSLLRALLPVLFASVLAGPPDEGQWLPQQVLEMDWDALRARGLTLSKDEFWHPERGGLLSAAVQINGCSATLISDQGLVVTNHHCAFGAIEAVSTVQKNYLRDGFVAASQQEELAAPGMILRVVRKIEDVSQKIHEAAEGATDDLDRVARVAEAQRKLIAEGEASESNTECSVASFFNGRVYHLYYRTRIQDVRLVYAPPRSVGEFGGEVDNWEWPRHTGDFTFLRAYVAPDGTPAPYAKSNVPYRPKHVIKVSEDGVAPGDLVMVLGYPGRTNRYLSSVAVEADEFQFHPLRNRYCTEYIRILEDRARGDAHLELRFSSQIKSLANVQKNALGMIKGLARNGVAARKLREEAEFSSWVSADPERARTYGGLLDELLEVDRSEATTRQRDFLLRSVPGNVRILADLMGLVRAVEARSADTPWGEIQRDAARVSREGGDNRWFEEPMLAFLVDEMMALPESQRLPGQSEVFGGLDGKAWAAMALTDNPLTSGEARRGLFLQGAEAVRQHPDPLLRLARLLDPEIQAASQRGQAREARRLVLGRRWIEAQQAWRGSTFYPDANGTLRVSIASVKGYVPRDGAFHSPQTTLAGVLEKQTGEEPFASPPALLEQARRPDQGRFVDPELGQVPVCFLSDGDTTGGNSGSGVIDGKGRLVGLNFDRVFENVSGDYGWNPDRSRNVCVDIRFVLWHLEKVLPAPHLLQEMGL